VDSDSHLIQKEWAKYSPLGGASIENNGWW